MAKSMKDWAVSGFPVVSKLILDERIKICHSCPRWDEIGMAGTGRCRECGCSTQAKLRMATERCPLGKWEAVDKEQIIVEQDK